jgi:hypothetical protein
MSQSVKLLRNEAIDTGMLYGLLNGARGVGYVSGGLASCCLKCAGESWQGSVMRRGMDHLSFSRDSRLCLVVGVCCGGGSGRSCCIWCEGRIKSPSVATVSSGSGAALR